ncbi:hypothetical protein Daus18300_006244 [Diaporthe australafricana]|uniref:Enoyl reductase (ER) domain-containing protein n=1 Tax=Diaporthe australafricana TaxID=127596 RepID=A0ABR3WW02_9PEZI
MGSVSLPTGRWVLDSAQEGISSLRYEPDATFTANQGNPSSAIPLPATPDVILGSDGAGVVVAVGSDVPKSSQWLQPGVKVMTHMIPHVADNTLPGFEDVASGLGQKLNGTLGRQAILHHSALVPMPSHMSFEEAATLTCSGLTAWNALMGMPGREVKKGDWVLTQGTGGVSVAALQIAVAAGATVVAITSSDEKADRLLSLGARHVINYKKHSNWGELARGLTPEKRGIDHVVDVVGPTTMAESLRALRLNGLLTVTGMIGGLGGGEQVPDLMSALWNLCIVRGIYLGSRSMFWDMVRFLEQKGIRPALDDVAFSLEEAKSAFERLERQEHFSKIVIKMS